jgi:hypothetical protein
VKPLNLKTVLEQYDAPTELLGSSEIDRKSLQEALKGLLSRLQILFWVAASIIVIVFIVELVAAILNWRDTTVLTGIGGATGLTIAGAGEAIRRITREMTQVSMIVLLAGELDREALAPIVHTLVEKL